MLTLSDVDGNIRPGLSCLSHSDRHAVRDKLKTEPWNDAGHGLFTRMVVHNGVAYTSTVQTCEVCGHLWPLTFMLKGDVWDSFAVRDDRLCFACAEARIGRQFTADDMDPNAHCNVELAYILRTRAAKSS